VVRTFCDGTIHKPAKLSILMFTISDSHIASQKPAAIPNALNAVARAGDVSGLCMSASLALLLDDSSAEERLARYKQEQDSSGKM
jgi:hypothetical protein